MALVPGRVCGGCTVCCHLPPIDTPDFQKQSGVACRFCVPAQGCTIHETLPPVCRDWFCGWRALPLLDDAWRPDQSGVMIALAADEVPPALAPYASTKFVILEPYGWRPSKRFISYVGALLEAGAATYLAVPGPPGHHQLKLLLNPTLTEASRRRDDFALGSGLAQVVANLATGPFASVILRHCPSGEAFGEE